MTKQIKFLVLMLTICSLAFFSSTCKKKPPVVIKPKDTTTTTGTKYVGELKVYGHIGTIAGSDAIGATINIYLTQDSMDSSKVFRTLSITSNPECNCAYFKDIPTFSVANKTRNIFIDGTFNYGGQDLSGQQVKAVATANKGTAAASVTLVLAP